MPVESYFSQLEPPEDTEVWRFMPLNRFEDLMANEELFFCRADLFKQDENEGIPPEDYLRRAFNLRKYDVQDEKTLLHQMGTLAQEREMFYVSCWHLARDEKAEMWKGFAESGVAIVSRYGLLKATLDGLLDRAFLGLVRYPGCSLAPAPRSVKWCKAPWQPWQIQQSWERVICTLLTGLFLTRNESPPLRQKSRPPRRFRALGVLAEP